MGGVFKHIDCKNKLINDKEPLIMEFHKFIANGGVIKLDYENYYDLEPLYKDFKQGKYHNIDLGIVGYVAYQCSFGGKKFDTFARDKKNLSRDFFKNGLSSLPKQPNYINTTILNLDYTQINIGSGSVVYLDPPYQNTNGYSVDFNYEGFEDYIAEIAKNNIVIISEYTQLRNTTIFDNFEFTRGMKDNKEGEGKKRKVNELILIHNNSLKYIETLKGNIKTHKIDKQYN